MMPGDRSPQNQLIRAHMDSQTEATVARPVFVPVPLCMCNDH